MNSGKNSWTTIRAAKNALENSLITPLDKLWEDQLEIIKELEREGIITYKQL